MQKVVLLPVVLPVTDEALADNPPTDWPRVLQERHARWRSLTPAERAAKTQAAKDQRAAQRAAAPPMPLTLDALIDKLGWTTDYARHLVQTYCTCEPQYDDGWHCEHLEELDRD